MNKKQKKQVQLKFYKIPLILIATPTKKSDKENKIIDFVRLKKMQLSD